MAERLGQHFLNDKGALDTIASAADPTDQEVVVEIGPGKGALTERLLSYATKVIAIEKDSFLVSYLKDKFKKEIGSKKLKLLEQDIRDFDPSLFCNDEGHYSIVANIPYYITGQIIRQFLTSACQPKNMTLLVQKEVAERIISKDGKESILSISIKAYGTPHYITTVPRTCFSPPPNVDSAVITITDISRTFFTNMDEKTFFTLVKTGFAHKRKKLVNNIESLVEPNTALHILSQHGYDENTRAEELDLLTWKKLARAAHL